MNDVIPQHRIPGNKPTIGQWNRVLSVICVVSEILSSVLCPIHIEKNHNYKKPGEADNSAV